jgi:hypothetical protein
MATNNYWDGTLATGSNDGTSWANAWQGAVGFVTAAAALAAGENLWCKNTVNLGGTYGDPARTLAFPVDNGNPVKVWGCKAATSAEPPVQSDLISGFATGGGSPATDSILPGYTAGANRAVVVSGSVHMYAISLEAGGLLALAYKANSTANLNEAYVECALGCGFDSAAARSIRFGGETTPFASGQIILTDCTFEFGHINNHLTPQAGNTSIIGGSVIGVVPTVLIEQIDAGQPGIGVSQERQGEFRMIGVDLSAVSTTLVDVSQVTGGLHLVLESCKLHASVSLTTGTNVGSMVKFVNCDSASGFSSDQSVQGYDYVTQQGTVSMETTAVRTNGANDGASGGFSWAMTPDVNETTEAYSALVSEWINRWVKGDGTSKTLTIYIANSGAADYFDDDVWVEVLNPTTDGTCGVEHNSTLLNLLATPAAITDDGGSAWGAGANNHQKFVVSIAPDYEGPIQARVHFAKRFASSPETLYVDPKLHLN